MTVDERVNARGAWMLQVLARRTFAKLQNVADAASIDVLPVKGIVTAHLLYDDFASRPLSDVDVRVRPGDLPRLREAGLRAGWKLVRDSKSYTNLIFALDGFTIDAETSVGPPGLTALAVDDMIGRAVPSMAPFGFRYLMPELHDHAFVLVVNVFKDKIVHAGPSAVEDLARIVEKEAFSTDRLIALAHEASATTLLAIVACWFAEHRPSDIWRELDRRSSERLSRPVYAGVVRSLIRRGDPFPFALRVLARLAADDGSMRRMAVGRAALEGWGASLIRRL